MVCIETEKGTATRVRRTYHFRILQILGILPFGICMKESKNLPCPRITLKPSGFWKIWSFIVMSSVIMMMAIDCYFSITNPRGKNIGYDTMIITHMIYDIITAFTTSHLQYLFWKTSDQLAEIIHLTESVRGSIQSDKVTFIVLLILLPVTILNCSLYGYFYMNLISTIEITCLIFKTFWVSVLMMVLGVIYHRGLFSGTAYLSKIMQPIDELFKAQTSWKDRFKINHDRNQISSCSGSNQKSDTHTPGELYVNVVSTVTENEFEFNDCSAKDSNMNIDFKCIKMGILRSYCILMDLNGYSGFKLATAMFCLLVWMLTSSFYMVLWHLLATGQKVISFCHATTAIAPLIYLLNSTHCVKRTVSFFTLFLMPYAYYTIFHVIAENNCDMNFIDIEILSIFFFRCWI